MPRGGISPERVTERRNGRSWTGVPSSPPFPLPAALGAARSSTTRSDARRSPPHAVSRSSACRPAAFRPRWAQRPAGGSRLRDSPRSPRGNSPPRAQLHPGHRTASLRSLRIPRASIPMAMRPRGNDCKRSRRCGAHLSSPHLCPAAAPHRAPLPPGRPRTPHPAVPPIQRNLGSSIL